MFYMFFIYMFYFQFNLFRCRFEMFQRKININKLLTRPIMGLERWNFGRMIARGMLNSVVSILSINQTCSRQDDSFVETILVDRAYCPSNVIIIDKNSYLNNIFNIATHMGRICGVFKTPSDRMWSTC